MQWGVGMHAMANTYTYTHTHRVSLVIHRMDGAKGKDRTKF